MRSNKGHCTSMLKSNLKDRVKLLCHKQMRSNKSHCTYMLKPNLKVDKLNLLCHKQIKTDEVNQRSLYFNAKTKPEGEQSKGALS